MLGLSGAMRSAHTLNELLASMGVFGHPGGHRQRGGAFVRRAGTWARALLFAAVLGVVLNWQVVDALLAG